MNDAALLLSGFLVLVPIALMLLDDYMGLKLTTLVMAGLFASGFLSSAVADGDEWLLLVQAPVVAVLWVATRDARRQWREARRARKEARKGAGPPGTPDPGH